MFVMRLLTQSSKGELTRLGVLVTGGRTKAGAGTDAGNQAGTEAVAR